MTGELIQQIEAVLAPLALGNARAEAEEIARTAAEEAARDRGLDAAVRAIALARRRAAGEPLGYVVGHQRFMGLMLSAAPGALIPREETELLGWSAVKKLKALSGGGGSGAALKTIDMCTGSGNLACGIAHALPELSVWASDLTDGCVTVARLNVERLGLSSRVKVFQGDLFVPLAGIGLEGSVDLVVCNPPYISAGRLAKDRAELLVHEPREAFDAGPYGLSIHQRVTKAALDFLKPGGYLMFEIGLGQEKQVSSLFDRSKAYDPVELKNDPHGNPRVVIGRKKAS